MLASLVVGDTAIYCKLSQLGDIRNAIPQQGQNRPSW